MINIFALLSLALAALHMAVAPVSAHGYVWYPPSRQYRCMVDKIPNCGPVMYEPQSVEALKGSFMCNGNGTRFPELNNDTLWQNHSFSAFTNSVPFFFPFGWKLTAPHTTASWEYFMIGNFSPIRLAMFYTPPSDNVWHNVSLYSYGRQTILARWNIGDTSQAFYSCVDIYLYYARASDAAMVMADAAALQLPIDMPGHPGQ